MDRIKCFSCNAETYNVYGATPLHCHSCYSDIEDELATLRAKLEQYRWIPVTERLPASKGFYLVTYANEIDKEAIEYYWTGYWWVCDDMDVDERLDRIGQINHDAVTHWMPLPQPPQDAADD